MLDAMVQVLRQHSEIALFLCLAVGYVIGKLRLGGHELGLVTGALFAGLLIGQLAIDIRPEIKTIFLLLFLFANGYGAGPQFFRALKQEGFAPLLLTLFTLEMGIAIVVEAILSFVGLSVSSGVPTWGGIIQEGRLYVNQAWWLMALPMTCIVVAVLGLNALGDGLRAALDPVKSK